MIAMSCHVMLCLVMCLVVLAVSVVSAAREVSALRISLPKCSVGGPLAQAIHLEDSLDLKQDQEREKEGPHSAHKQSTTHSDALLTHDDTCPPPGYRFPVHDFVC